MSDIDLAIILEAEELRLYQEEQIELEFHYRSESELLPSSDNLAQD